MYICIITLVFRFTRRRIESLGGFVSYIGCWRAMGILAMSRAIGDLFLKPYVSAIPGVHTPPASTCYSQDTG